MVSDADCRASYGESDITDSMICGGFAAGGKDSCQVMPRLTAREDSLREERTPTRYCKDLKPWRIRLSGGFRSGGKDSYQENF